ncbi:MAG: PAS domain-containing sensor histidine kinase [Armatimonadota bacterium]
MADAKDLPPASPGRARQLRADLLTTHQDAVQQQYSQLGAMRGAATACGCLVLLLGALGLLGRITGLFILGSFIPGGRCMPVAVAFSFLFLGPALVALSLRSRVSAWFVRACGGIVILTALARLAEHFRGAQWGVEDLFLTRFLPSTSLDTGYLEFGAAALILIGVATVAFTWPRARMATIALAIATATLGAIVCLSYLLGRPLLYRSPEGPVALPSALAIVAMGVGLAIIVRAWGRAADLVTEAMVEANQTKLARLSDEFERQRNELEAMVSNAPNGIVSFDRDGQIVRMNRVGQEMLGQVLLTMAEERKELAAVPDIIDEQGQPVPLEETPIHRALRGETVEHMVVNLPKAAKGPIWVSASAVPLYDAEGQIDGALLVMTDITPLREAREAAQRAAHELQTIMDYAPVGIIFYDYKGNIRRMNETAKAALGMTQEMMGRSADERFMEHDIVDEQGTPITPGTGVVAAVLGGATVRNVLANFRNTPMGSIWLSVSGAPLPRGNGTGMDGVIAVFSDVTRLHQTQEKAQQLASELETVLTSIADGVVVYDAQGKPLRTNPAAELLLQYTPEIKAMTWQERSRIVVPVGKDGERLAPAEFPLIRALNGERIVGFTMRFQLPLNGDSAFTPWLSVSAAPVHHDGEVVGAVLVFADISRMRQAEEELISYRDHLERLVSERTADLEANQQRLRALAAELVTAEQSERQRLAGVIHDEVAQTLGVIKLRLQMLQADERAALLAAQISELIEMTADAISQSRMIMVELSPPILQKEGLVQALRWWAEQVLERHGLGVEVSVVGSADGLDKNLEIAAFQAVKELLQNTVKHAHATQAAIRLACSEDHFTIEVADDGVGFDPAAAPTPEEGGFGLFSVRERMAYLGGDFRIDSAPGQGTRSSITLPVRCKEYA